MNFTTNSNEECLDEQLNNSLSFLDNSLKDLRSFTRTSIKEITQQKVSEVSDIISEIRAEISSAERRIKRLSLTDGTSPAKHSRLLKESETALNRFKGSFRELVLESKLVIDKFQQNILLGINNYDSASPNLRSKKKGANNVSAIRTAASVTESLKRTGSLLEAEINRSATSYQALTESSRILEETRHTYTGITSVMEQSRRLLGGLEWSEILDHIILMVGFFIFSATVLYVLSKRIYIPFISPLTFIRYIYYMIWYVGFGAKSLVSSFLNNSSSITPAFPEPTTKIFTSVPSNFTSAFNSNVCYSSFGSVFTYPTCGLKP